MLTQIAHSVWKRNEVQLLGSTDIYTATLKTLFFFKNVTFQRILRIHNHHCINNSLYTCSSLKWQIVPRCANKSLFPPLLPSVKPYDQPLLFNMVYEVLRFIV